MTPPKPEPKKPRGRPVEVEGGAEVTLNVRMSVTQREKVRRNGGGGWVRGLIDRAKDKPHPG